MKNCIHRTLRELLPSASTAMVDLLIHHSEILSLKGDSYRLKDRDLGRVPRPATTAKDAQ